MQTKIYVGNLNYNASEQDLNDLFAKYGTVQSVNIIKDRYTGQAKGFAFVEMSSSEEAEKALELNGSEFLGRSITVSEARPQEPRSGGRRWGGGGGSGGGGGRPGKRRGGFGGGPRRDRDW